MAITRFARVIRCRGYIIFDFRCFVEENRSDDLNGVTVQFSLFEYPAKDFGSENDRWFLAGFLKLNILKY